MAASKFPHLLFVYGTLKQGFFNHARCMLPNADHYQYIAPATVPGFLLVDAYSIPYLLMRQADLVADQKSVASPADVDSAKPVKKLNQTFPTLPVEGEIYKIDDTMLGILDDLEGISYGRYTRSVVHPTLTADMQDNDQQADNQQADNHQTDSQTADNQQSDSQMADNQQADSQLESPLQCFIYHLQWVPDRLLERQPLDSYRQEHTEGYIPPGSRDQAKYNEEWGGYE